MSTALSASQLTLKPSLLRSNATSLSPTVSCTRNQTTQFRYSSTKPLLLNHIDTNHVFLFSRKLQPLFLYRRNYGFCASGGGKGESSDGVDEGGRLVYRWPWLIVVPILIYVWRAVLFEVSNWQKLAMTIFGFFCDLSALALALVFNFIGDPITFLFRCIEAAYLIIRSYYNGIVAYAPVGELCLLITLPSAVIAIAEATNRDSVHGQPYVIAGLVGYAAVKGYIAGPLFWTLLVGWYGFSRVVKKRDNVSSVMPVAALLAAIGEPWVRIVVMSSYLGLAMCQHWKGNVGVGSVRRERKLPLPLLGAALAIGVHFGANWCGNTHLAWMLS